jgi:anti-sigma factor RsiW
MNCTDVTKEIPNYCYGEVSSEAEEAVESHLADCKTCQTELARHKKFLTLFDERTAMVDAGLLVECRAKLSAAVKLEATARAQHGAGWRGWQRVMEHLRDFSRMQIPFRVPVRIRASADCGG